MTRCSITCQEPGCTEQIRYDTEEQTQTYIYCWKHRSKEGRHAATRPVQRKQ